jgi:hypothetical protein
VKKTDTCFEVTGWHKGEELLTKFYLLKLLKIKETWEAGRVGPQMKLDTQLSWESEAFQIPMALTVHCIDEEAKPTKTNNLPSPLCPLRCKSLPTEVFHLCLSFYLSPRCMGECLYIFFRPKAVLSFLFFLVEQFDPFGTVTFLVES